MGTFSSIKFWQSNNTTADTLPRHNDSASRSRSTSSTANRVKAGLAGLGALTLAGAAGGLVLGDVRGVQMVKKDFDDRTQDGARIASDVFASFGMFATPELIIGLLVCSGLSAKYAYDKLRE